MKKIWKILGLVLTVFLIVGFVGAYWMGDFLFKSMLKAGDVNQFEKMTQSTSESSDPGTNSGALTEPEKTDLDSIVATISAKDKLTIAALVTGNLTGNDITTLFQLIRDGELTTDEKKVALDLCYQRFSADEVEKIKSFFLKYQGNVSIVP